ncbi:hypothetical protein Pint_26085 [Pistacia integerrima]|uniref:Uncharacterized protein n=1 Tax=Pistacia integerrima TaxID=434235 RepID=A0ACC0YH39_9ROSI|nr:hypothetical protein Pint_26085 [Pistacia integerrima]
MAEALRSLYVCVVFSLSLMSFALAQGENYFIFHGFSDSNLHLDGVAEIQPSGLLQLTHFDSTIAMAHAFYPFPFRFNTSSSQSLSFSTNFVFAMDGLGHGMAFVISPSMDFSKAVPGGYLGLFNHSNNGLSTNHILAVELNCVLSPEFYDIESNHVGININSLISNQSAPATYFSNEERIDKSLSLADRDAIQIWIDYSAAEMLLNVTLAPIKVPKPSKPLLSKPLDLSEILLDSMYVGFSASTDQPGSSSYILGWSFNRTGQARNLDISKLPPVPKDPSSFLGRILISIMLACPFIPVIGIGVWVYIDMKKKYEEVYEDWEKEYSPQRISYKQLYTASKGFRDSELIGKGGLGKVYRGVLPSSNKQIAIKKVSHDSKQGMKEFVAEIASMGRLRHRNLVKLCGYCRREGELLLVYDYMPNGSLDKMLYSNTSPKLSWFQRFRIIRGIASGLLYLHGEWEQVVLHRDIKPGNVLLDADLNGKLGDFGLARLHDHGGNPQTTKLVGTFGYMAPELIRTGKATTCTDVYAFGVFMLEVACGKRPIEQRGLPKRGNLVYGVASSWERGSILDASDPQLEGAFAADEMELVLKLGLFCCFGNPAARPSMRQVMQYLDGDVLLPDVPSTSNITSLFTANDETPDDEIPFPSLFGNGSVAAVSSTDSILVVGR